VSGATTGGGIKIYADGASLPELSELAQNPRISGFTTNPTLMRKAGVEAKPISFEVFADDLDEMARQARQIASFGENVYVKLPITNTRRVSVLPLARELSRAGIKLNITAICTSRQIEESAEALRGGAAAVVSVFAGRIADTGRDPIPMMVAAVATCAAACAGGSPIELLWASPRELLNLIHAEQAGCQIITVTSDLLKKLSLLGKDLEEFSLETVQMFHRDASAAGYAL
jgi:transaldolase